MDKEFRPETTIEILKNSTFFRELNQEQLGHLYALSRIERHEPGSVIIREGQINEKLYVLMAGSVAVYIGEERISRMRRAGDIIGEISVLTHAPTTATVVADSAVTLFYIPAKSIHDSNRPDLNALWMKIFPDILKDRLSTANQNLLGFQATSEELDRKKRELHQKTMILQSVMGSMGDGVVVVDESGNILHVNEAFCRMVGTRHIPGGAPDWPRTAGLYASDKTRPCTVRDLVSKRPGKRGGTGQESEIREIFVKNEFLDRELWLHASSSILRMEDGSDLGGAVIVFRDYTRKKQEEQALVKAKEHAEETARAKGNFLSVMSHELRTPMGAILGMAEILRKSTLTPEQEENITHIAGSSRELLDKIKNILDFNHLESGEIQLVRQPYALKQVMDGLKAMYLPKARSNTVTLSMNFSSKNGDTFLGDREHLSQVLGNLIDNAIKFSPNGRVTVEVTEAAPDISEADATPLEIPLRFKVTDTGIGMSRDEIARLFTPFSQADVSYSRKFEGTGLGLAVSNRLVKLMGGTIRVESIPGSGSTFSFTVSQEKQAPAPPSDRAPGAQEPAGQLSILIAEDNLVNQAVAKKKLKKMGFSPKTVLNGLEAVRICEQEYFDLILMDIQMPEMDGIRACRTILAENPHPRPPVIVALTANVSEGIQQECYDAGMKDFLAKPLDVERLRQILNALPGV